MESLTELCLATLPPVRPETVWAGWSFAPEIVLPLLLILGLFARVRPDRAGSAASAMAFLAGWGLLVLALVSPLCRLAAGLASAHMAQHVLLVALAPPLLALGVGLPRQLPCRPAAASALYAGVIWAAHLPSVYQAALTGAVPHLLLLAALLGASWLFWATLMAAPAGPAIGMAFSALIATGLLGALLTFAPAPWYPLFGAGPIGWGLSPLEDQQIAGLIMWVPMGGIYLAAGLAVLARLLGRLEQAGAR